MVLPDHSHLLFKDIRGNNTDRKGLANADREG